MRALQSYPLKVSILLLPFIFWACGEDTGKNTTAVPGSSNNPDANSGTTGQNNLQPNTDPNAQPNNTTSPSNNQTANNTSSNTSTPGNTGNNTIPMTCEGENCEMEWDVFGECDFVDDQGMLTPAPGFTTSFRGTTVGLESDIESSCALDAATAAEYVWSFVPTQAAFVTIDIEDGGGLDWVISTRLGECEPGAELVCRDSGVIDYLAQEGERQFVIAEPVAGVQRGAIALNIALEPAVCSNLGGRTCEGADVAICEGGTKQSVYGCGTGCSMGACEGNTCDTAAVLAGPGEFSSQGNLTAYTNTFDAKDIASCSLDGLLSTPGAEQIVRVTGVQAGQTITVDAKDTLDKNDNAIMIMRGCGASAECLEVVETPDSLQWTAPEAGDYTVIIDTITSTSKEFKHTITLE